MSLPHPAFGGTVASLTKNNLMMPGKDPVLVPWTILTGQDLKAGSVLGVVTASGKAVLSLSAAGDGSEIPRFILLEDLNTASPAGDKVFNVAAEGYFNETALVIGTGHTADSIRVALRDRGIYLSAPRYSFA